jgi:cardiolipin synthase A/B
MHAPDLARLRSWTSIPRPNFLGGNALQLLEGGDALFPRMCQAIAQARREVWMATYIFNTDRSGKLVMDALAAAAARGVAVHLVLDGFGTAATLAALRARMEPAGVRIEIFRPLERWYSWLQPSHMRRLHQKLCVCDETVAFVGGINVIDDRLDLTHGWSELPRLDFAVELSGPLATSVHTTARAMWARAHLGHSWREQVLTVARSSKPVDQALAKMRELRLSPETRVAETTDANVSASGAALAAARAVTAATAAAGAARDGAVASGDSAIAPMSAAFIVRDNLSQRRAIERSYVEAIRHAQRSVDIAVPYFYPGRSFRSALRGAADRGVQVRLLLQGKVDYKVAAMAARALYAEMQAHGVRIFEYTPAFLHAKVAVVDGHWATVGSSNIDPISLLLNLEANVVVHNTEFARSLAERFEVAFAVSHEVTSEQRWVGVRGWLGRAVVAWGARLYLRVAGITGRY